MSVLALRSVFGPRRLVASDSNAAMYGSALNDGFAIVGFELGPSASTGPAPSGSLSAMFVSAVRLRRMMSDALLVSAPPAGLRLVASVAYATMVPPGSTVDSPLG